MSDDESISVFVNERRVRLSPGATALEAVRVLDAGLAQAVAAGRAYLTDGRGVRCVPEAPLSPGAILRVIRPARRAGERHADP